MSKKACKKENKKTTKEAEYKCKKCGACANKEKNLCKPKKT
jgi:hypothetical protein